MTAYLPRLPLELASSQQRQGKSMEVPEGEVLSGLPYKNSSFQLSHKEPGKWVVDIMQEERVSLENLPHT